MSDRMVNEVIAESEAIILSDNLCGYTLELSGKSVFVKENIIGGMYSSIFLPSKIFRTDVSRFLKSFLDNWPDRFDKDPRTFIMLNETTTVIVLTLTPYNSSFRYSDTPAIQMYMCMNFNNDGSSLLTNVYRGLLKASEVMALYNFMKEEDDEIDRNTKGNN